MLQKSMLLNFHDFKQCKKINFKSCQQIED